MSELNGRRMFQLEYDKNVNAWWSAKENKYYTYLTPELATLNGIDWYELELAVGSFTDWQAGPCDYKIEYLQAPTFQEFIGAAESYIERNTRKAYYRILKFGKEESCGLELPEAKFLADKLLKLACPVVYMYNYMKNRTRFANEQAFKMFQAYLPELRVISKLAQVVHPTTWLKLPECFHWLRSIGRMKQIRYDIRDSVGIFFGSVQKTINRFKGKATNSFIVSLPTIGEVKKVAYKLPEKITEKVYVLFHKLNDTADIPWDVNQFAKIEHAHPIYQIIAYKFNLTDVTEDIYQAAQNYLDKLDDAWAERYVT